MMPNKSTYVQSMTLCVRCRKNCLLSAAEGSCDPFAPIVCVCVCVLFCCKENKATICCKGQSNYKINFIINTLRGSPSTAQ